MLRHHAPPPGAGIKGKPFACCATLTPLAVVAQHACLLREKCGRRSPKGMPKIRSPTEAVQGRNFLARGLLF
jgi:hypothetical protein